MAGKPMAAAVRPMNWRRVVETGWRFMVGEENRLAAILQGSGAGVKGFRWRMGGGGAKRWDHGERTF
jgi:hypothetical protein